MDDEIKELIQDYDLDEDTAERVQDIMNELDVDPDDAVELEECF